MTRTRKKSLVIRPKYCPKEVVIVNKVEYEVLSVRTHTTNHFKPVTNIEYYLQDHSGRGCTVSEQAIEKSTGKFPECFRLS